MTRPHDLANLVVAGSGNPDEDLAALALMDLLRALEHEAQRAGFAFSATVIALAAEAAFQEGVVIGPTILH